MEGMEGLEGFFQIRVPEKKPNHLESVLLFFENVKTFLATHTLLTLHRRFLSSFILSA